MFWSLQKPYTWKLFFEVKVFGLSFIWTITAVVDKDDIRLSPDDVTLFGTPSMIRLIHFVQKGVYNSSY